MSEMHEGDQSEPQNVDGQNRHTLNKWSARLFSNINGRFEAYRQKGLCSDYRRERRERVTIFGIFLTAAFALGQGFIFYFQLREMRDSGIQAEHLVTSNGNLARAAAKQAEAAEQQARASVEYAEVARDSLVASARAWVGPRNAKIVGSVEAGKPIEVAIEYGNSGKEPALNFIVRTDSFITDQDRIGEINDRQRRYLEGCQDTKFDDPGVAVFPSTGFSANNMSSKTLVNAGQDIIDGSKTFHIQACFLYKTFGVLRHTYFCYFYNSKLSKIENLSICPQGHYAD